MSKVRGPVPDTHGTRRRQMKRLPTALCLLLGSAGCFAWRPVELGSEPHPVIVRVTTPAGQTIVDNARVVGDSLIVGEVHRASPLQERKAFSAPLVGVEQIKEQYLSGRRTAVLAVFLPAIFFGALGLLYLSPIG
jgi:hypothetical protein